MNALLYIYEIDDDPIYYQWGYRTKVIDLLIPEFRCGINDQGACFGIDTYHANDRKAVTVTINEELRNRISSAIELKKRKKKKIFRQLLLEVLVASVTSV